MDVSLMIEMGVYGPDSRVCFKGRYHGHNRFPEGTRGFLYYNSPKVGVPLAAGELRFRVTPGDTPASFVQGSDLLLETGLPWSIPLLVMVEKSESIRKGQQYQPIRQVLLDDGFITPALLETCAALVNSNRCKPIRGSRIIHSFGQLFHITFDLIHLPFFTLSMNRLKYRRPLLRCSGHDDIGHYTTPYSGECTRIAWFMPILLKSQPPGSALCCFERSNLPQHKGTRKAVIRIVKIISPVTCRYPNYNGPAPLPVEGELLQSNFTTRLRPISFNVDLLDGHGAVNDVSGRELIGDARVR
jgi:hypothetical protein